MRTVRDPRFAAEAVVLNDKLSRSGGYRSVPENGPKSTVSLRTESGFGVRREVGRDDADQERSQNWTATIRRLSARTGRRREAARVDTERVVPAAANASRRAVQARRV